MAKDLIDSFDYRAYCLEAELYTMAKRRVTEFAHHSAYKSHKLYQRDLETIDLFEKKYPMCGQKESE